MTSNKTMQGKMTTRFARIASLGLVLLITALNLSPAAVSAVSTTGNGFIISPVREELTISKGQTATVQMSVQNPTTGPLDAEAIVNDFQANPNESGVPDLILNNKPPFPVNDFRTLVSPIKEFALAPGQKDYMNVQFHVPADAASGGYYGAIRFVPVGITTSKGANVGLTASVGALFLVTVPGHLVQKLSLVQLATVNSANTPESIFYTGNVSLMTRIDNTGNIHLAPYGTVNVTDMTGHVVYHYNFNSTQGNILPGSIRKFIDPLAHKGWLGEYKVSVYIAWTQGSGNILYGSTTFWYFPIWFILLVIVVVVLIIAGLVYRNKKKQKRQAAKAPKTSKT